MRISLAATAMLLMTSTVLAQDSAFELRAGPAFHGLQLTAKGIFDPFAHGGSIEDLSVELIYTPPVDLSLLASPRLALGGTFNFRGMENMVHANANWHVPVFSTPVYVEAGLGVAYVTGYLHNAPPPYHSLGCHTMFYFQAGIGAELPGGWTATLSEEHSSHDWLCGPDNDGLNSISLKAGHKF
jgi:lipid A 3-O-deacylase